MRSRFLSALVAAALASSTVSFAAEQAGQGHYMLAWAGDQDHRGGALQLDRAFHDASGRPGFDTGSRSWPHGWNGAAIVHGIVFSK